MNKWASISPLTFVLIYLATAILPTQVRAQIPRPDWSPAPLLSDLLDLQTSIDPAALVDNPLPDGLSLQALGDLLKGLASQKKSITRGAQEIAIFRQAAPAVVLLRTKEASGSGVVLQNGLILTNR